MSQDIDRDSGQTAHDILIKAEDPVGGRLTPCTWHLVKIIIRFDSLYFFPMTGRPERSDLCARGGGGPE